MWGGLGQRLCVPVPRAHPDTSLTSRVSNVASSGRNTLLGRPEDLDRLEVALHRQGPAPRVALLV